MNAREADTQLFEGILWCSLEVPVSLMPLASTGIDAASDAAIRLLHAVALVEDNPPEETNNDHAAGDRAQLRLEAKLDLALGLLARMLVRDESGHPARVPLRLSHRGACLEFPAAGSTPILPAPGSHVMLALPAAAWLPRDLELPASALYAERTPAGAIRLWLAFAGTDDGLGDALDRHLFRLHRRAIAHERRHR